MPLSVRIHLQPHRHNHIPTAPDSLDDYDMDDYLLALESIELHSHCYTVRGSLSENCDRCEIKGVHPQSDFETLYMPRVSAYLSPLITSGLRPALGSICE